MFISRVFWLGARWRERFPPCSHESLSSKRRRIDMNFQSAKGKAKPYQVRQLLDAIDGLDHA